MPDTLSDNIVVGVGEWVLRRTGSTTMSETPLDFFGTTSATVSGPKIGQYVAAAFSISDTAYVDTLQAVVTHSLTSPYSLSHMLYDDRDLITELASASSYLPSIVNSATTISLYLQPAVRLEANKKYWWVFRSENNIPGGPFAFYRSTGSSGSAGEIYTKSNTDDIQDKVAQFTNSGIFVKITSSAPSSKNWLPFYIESAAFEISNKLGYSNRPRTDTPKIATYLFRGSTASFYKRETSITGRVMNVLGAQLIDDRLRRLADSREILRLESRYQTYSRVVLENWSVKPLPGPDKHATVRMALSILDK